VLFSNSFVLDVIRPEQRTIVSAGVFSTASVNCGEGLAPVLDITYLLPFNGLRGNTVPDSNINIPPRPGFSVSLWRLAPAPNHPC
jgi:hypothetical protein